MPSRGVARAALLNDPRYGPQYSARQLLHTTSTIPLPYASSSPQPGASLRPLMMLNDIGATHLRADVS